MQHQKYVFILGSYDSTLVGPFSSRRRAESFCDAHFMGSTEFNLYIWSQADYEANVAEFGAIEALSVDQYIAAEVANV